LLSFCFYQGKTAVGRLSSDSHGLLDPMTLKEMKRKSKARWQKINRYALYMRMS
jgi:hypothetical protein